MCSAGPPGELTDYVLRAKLSQRGYARGTRDSIGDRRGASGRKVQWGELMPTRRARGGTCGKCGELENGGKRQNERERKIGAQGEHQARTQYGSKGGVKAVEPHSEQDCNI